MSRCDDVTLAQYAPDRLVHRARPLDLYTFASMCGITFDPDRVRSGSPFEVNCLWCVAGRNHRYKTL